MLELRSHGLICVLRESRRSRCVFTCSHKEQGAQNGGQQIPSLTEAEEQDDAENKLPSLHRFHDMEDISASLRSVLLRRQQGHLDDSSLPSCSSWEELVSLLQPWEACIVMNQIARVCPKRGGGGSSLVEAERLMTCLSARLAPSMHGLSSKNVAWALNAAKKVPHSDGSSLFLAAATYLPQTLPADFGAQNLALVANAMAWMSQRMEEAEEEGGEGNLKERMKDSGCAGFLQEAARNISVEEWKKRPRALSMFVQAAGKLEMRGEEFSKHMMRVLQDKEMLHGLVAGGGGQSVALVVHAVDMMELEESEKEELKQSLEEAVLLVPPSKFGSQETSMILRGLLTSRDCKAEVVDHLQEAALLIPSKLWSPQAVAHTLNALATSFSSSSSSSSSSSERVFRHLLSVISSWDLLRADFLPQHLALILAACARARFNSRFLLQLVHDTLEKRKDWMPIEQGQDLSRFPPPGKGEGRGRGGRRTRTRSSAFKDVELAAIANACTKIYSDLKEPHGELDASSSSRGFPSEVWRIFEQLCVLSTSSLSSPYPPSSSNSSAISPAASLVASFARAEFRCLPFLRTMTTNLLAADDLPLDSIAQVLHAFAVLGWEEERVVQHLLSLLLLHPPADFNAMTLGKLSWACAVLNVRDERVVSLLLQAIDRLFYELLEGREAEVTSRRAGGGTGTGAGEGTGAGAGAGDGRTVMMKYQDLREVRQVHQFLLNCRLEKVMETWKEEEEEVWRVRENISKKIFEARSRNRAMLSSLQAEIQRKLKEMSYKIKTEVIDEKSGYSIDIVIRSGEGVDEEHPIAVEVDGPGHYMRPGLRELVGGTKMKTRHLCRLGWKVVAIPYWEWNEARDAGEEERYLSQRIAAAASSP